VNSAYAVSAVTLVCLATLVIGAVVLGEPITAVGLAGIAVIVVAAMACIRLRRGLDAGTP
jgi:drug/metabolite transporter (DMT)-like permease